MPTATLQSRSSFSAATADDLAIELAIENGVLQPHDVDAARTVLRASGLADTTLTKTAEPQRSYGPLVERLIAQRLITPRRVAELLAVKSGYAVAPDLAEVTIDPALGQRVPASLARRHTLLPLGEEAGRLRIAIADPLEAAGVDALGYLGHQSIEPLIAPPAEIAAAIDRFYRDHTGRDRPQGPLAADSALSPVRGVATANEQIGDSDASIIRRVHGIILAAIRSRASDIHLEPLETRFRVRYRVDGVLVEVENPPKALQLVIISRLKIMANISIAEKRVPQDGRIQFPHDGRQVDLRVSSLPTAHGESIVMRILDPAGLQLGLSELGFFEDDAALFRRLIGLPDGILLVTGPTGSGKTTTLYSCLHAINQPDRKIITVEDPVEYQLNGINQVPVRHDVGMTFASALRAMLRQAPNIIMVGEIRDLETAEISINASLTGHLVFSTLHTNDAPGAIARLADIGVKPFLVATSLRAVVAQRLVRKICSVCRREYVPTVAELKALDLHSEASGPIRFCRGEGCPRCEGTGFRGRLGIFELFTITDEIQRLIYAGASVARLRAEARAAGMRTLREDGARKVIAGLTTVEEVASITIGDAA